jgi:dTDP-4-amino-4,6-dideoxygalactose transaminase
LTRDTALDTLAHALESIWNHHANPVSDRLAGEVLSLPMHADLSEADQDRVVDAVKTALKD